ncbi:hypothetical protein [Pseudonocardia asaccharolytica]|uniref:Chemotaxis protein n=1 Tax=Pseudonocardia asaccharolytica DSM 44247 = NBRC 16224 TaxID=1123024 RepID=A0A511CXW6_9PSEU|nr:hypothetical protein [Pseudonocardia asaccharolytica]GEL17415.1 hypothetical protein PA7_12520 [Pseudonocardia asaccharolytica DSM 44247 = NBRC 16224]
MTRIAVAIVHGIEIADPAFAATPTRLLREGFARELGVGVADTEDMLVVEPVHWAPHLEERQRELFARIYPGQTGPSFVDELSRLIKMINAGSVAALVPFAASLLNPIRCGLRALRYPAARWMVLHFVGDAIAYDRTAGAANYTAIHETFARGLAALARRAGEGAPLCVIAHSFGTVLASDYVYDQQQSAQGRALVAPAVAAAAGPAPLARGETLGWFYTMGSPLALWSLRYPAAELDRPIGFPGGALADRYPALPGEWVNFYDADDVLAYPLTGLSPEYGRVVEDRAVSLHGWNPIFATPLAHPYYWTDRSVMRRIARSLAAGWRLLGE